MFIKMGVSLGLITWFALRIELKAAWEITASIPLAAIIIIFLISIAGQAVCAYKWRLLSSHFGVKKSTLHYVRMYLIGAFLNNFLPTTVGGDLGRAGIMARDENLSYNQALSTVFVERLTGLFILILSSLIGGVYFYNISGNKTVALWSIGCFIGIVLLSVPLFSSSADKALKWLPDFVHKFFSYTRIFKEKRPLILIAILLSILFYCTEFFIHWGILALLGQKINFMYIVALVPIVYLVSMLPITINGIGVRENAYLFFFGFIGLNPEIISSMALVILILVLAQGLLGGLLLLGYSVKTERLNGGKDESTL